MRRADKNGINIFLIAGLFFVAPVLSNAEVSASRVRPVGHKLEEQVTALADTPEEAQQLKALFSSLEYHVVEDDEINAFAARTQNTIVVNRGILDLVDNDDELAFVIAHEMGHVLVGQMKKVEFEKLLEEISEQDPQIKNEAMLDELIGDGAGVTLMHKAGFDSDAAVKFFRRLIEQRGELEWAEIWLKDQSTVDDVHLIEETRLKMVSDVAERLREEDEGRGKTQEIPYIWIGKFSVTYQDAAGKQQADESTDTLGIYTEKDFQLAQGMEVEARSELIRKFMLRKFTGQVTRVLKVELKGVERQVFQEHEEGEK